MVGPGPSPAGRYPLPPKSDLEVEAILARYRAGLGELYGERLRGLHLFGSYARGEAESGSDLDVLIVLDEVESSWREIERTSRLTAALSLEHDVTVCGVFASERAWEAAETPFLRRVRREARGSPSA